MVRKKSWTGRTRRRAPARTWRRPRRRPWCLWVTACACRKPGTTIWLVSTCGARLRCMSTAREPWTQSTRADLAPTTEAAMVFVGYGLRVPEARYDDLAGVDRSEERRVGKECRS